MLLALTPPSVTPGSFFHKLLLLTKGEEAKTNSMSEEEAAEPAGSPALVSTIHVLPIVIIALCLVLHAVLWTFDGGVDHTGRRVSGWREWLSHMIVPLCVVQSVVVPSEASTEVWACATVVSVIAKVTESPPPSDGCTTIR